MLNAKEKFNLHGWDDEKIYFWNKETGKEYCVNDEEKLYKKLLQVCIEYFKNKDKND